MQEWEEVIQTHWQSVAVAPPITLQVLYSYISHEVIFYSLHILPNFFVQLFDINFYFLGLHNNQQPLHGNLNSSNSLMKNNQSMLSGGLLGGSHFSGFGGGSLSHSSLMAYPPPLSNNNSNTNNSGLPTELQQSQHASGNTAFQNRS